MAGKAFFFYGEDEFSIAEAVDAVRASLGPREALAANTVVLDGRRVSFAEMRMVCDTIPFLAEHRLVILEGLPDRFEGQGGRRGGRRPARRQPEPELGEWGGLAAYIPALPQPTTLVLTGGDIDQRNPVLESLQSVAQCRSFPALRGAKLHEWAGTRARARGARLAPGAQRLLAEMSSGNLRLLAQEIDKLATFAGQETISEEAVRRLVTSAREASIFELIDALVQRRQTDAMLALEQLLAQGEPVPLILTMLARQLRYMVQAKTLAAEGAGRDEIMSALGTRSDFVVDKTIEQARAYSLAALKALYERLVETDLSIKSGEVSEELAMELLVAEMAGRRW